MPRKPDPVTFKVTIRSGSGLGGGDIPALLDMLRYEGGQVVSWNYSKDGYEVTIRNEERTRHAYDRWTSFGIVPRYS